MKRVNYMSAGLIAMTLAGVMLPITSVFAADEPIKKTSVGEVRVGVDPDNPDPNNPDNPDGSKDILSLVKVPDLKFKSVSVEQLATGQQTLPLTSNAVTDKPVKNEPAGNASDGNNQGLLNITDYRGTGAGWKLEAQAGELKNAAGQKLAGSLLLAGVAKTDETDNNPTAISQAELVLEGSGVQVWNAASGQGQGRNTGVFTSADTVLKLSQNTAAYGGKYQTAITWTLTNAPA
ncbi:WxL domain-containing protein [Lacticaseibacillus paracasei]|uniref:WxL domain-containing protein n=1 Tax=Lacticaseibacillus paracasei TaxID=1597 RepID=UPI0003435F76|nr:WxL domain-containing protein [Lacticaseibacillus paracasei]EPC11816.1 cell surface complex protein, CscB family [Lacticaseibacillus paracasei subsp. paracasei Lpp230]MDP0527516.1 WxL domain-containing protein [Lacticaseibacillus paracasei]UNG78407.1 WxL domain-containing protein [Lacticaseibacillus paracasei]